VALFVQTKAPASSSQPPQILLIFHKASPLESSNNQLFSLGGKYFFFKNGQRSTHALQIADEHYQAADF
jgi:hypothetical protein